MSWLIKLIKAFFRFSLKKEERLRRTYTNLVGEVPSSLFFRKVKYVVLVTGALV